MTKTYNEIYIKTRRTLKDAGVEGCDLEARLLISAAAGKTVQALLRDMKLYAAEGLEEQVSAWVQRRIAGEPVAYITGTWEFFDTELTITPDVLIPRADTEVLARAAVTLFKGRNTHPRILDLCCGSGCIGCSLALHMPAARVIMVDIDPAALRVCRENILRYNFGPRVLCLDADATKKPPVLLGDFDLIVCNAPYIPSGDIAGLDPMVRDYEPIRALDGGEDGLAIIRPVISLWKRVLRDRGVLMLEICEGQSEAVQSLLEEAGFEDIRALEDFGGCERVVMARLP